MRKDLHQNTVTAEFEATMKVTELIAATNRTL